MFILLLIFIILVFIVIYNPKQYEQLIYIYIYIRGAMVSKIHGSVRYDAVVSLFGTFSIQGAGQLVMSQCLKYLCFKPRMDITQAAFAHMQTLQDLCR